MSKMVDGLGAPGTFETPRSNCTIRNVRDVVDPRKATTGACGAFRMNQPTACSHRRLSVIAFFAGKRNPRRFTKFDRKLRDAETINVVPDLSR